KNGGFELAGRPWQAHGLSYFMPYVAGQPNMNQWLPFLNPELYDPDIVDSDLSRIAKLGMTAVVIPYADLVQADSISDMLIRCQRYGIKVIMFIGYGVADPLNYNLELLERKIKIASLDRQPALLAIEPAWEPHFGARDERKKFDALWTKWVIEQYGSLQSAFKSWGFSPIVNGDTIEGPSDQQLIQVGPSQVMVAAYRRFTDDFVSRNYGMITRTIRKLCPHSLIGTRTGWGSSCSLWIDSRMPFDMISGAAHLDYISPEAYGLLYGPWSRVEDGKLVTALARYDGHGKPIVWMEYGQTIVDIFRGVWKQDSLNYFTQDKFVRNILRLMKEVQASGSFAWWWPGGYRIEEKSDFGFTEPFGSPRPALRTLSSMIPELMSQKGEYKTQKDIIIDRDMHPRGASMIIERHRKEFLYLDHQGIHAGFCTEGTNKTTENVLLVGIGNVPFQKGMPPKYINAEFVKVEVMLQDNSWHEIQRDQKVSGVPLKHPIELRITALNTDDVAWDARQDSDGLVKLRVQCSDKNISETPVVKEIRWGQVCTMSMSLSEPYRSGLFTLRFGCNRVGGFGETFHFELN
ncbi:MAG TPA: beta-galactosidase, partial [Methylococcales bacterium]